MPAPSHAVSLLAHSQKPTRSHIHNCVGTHTSTFSSHARQQCSDQLSQRRRVGIGILIKLLCAGGSVPRDSLCICKILRLVLLLLHDEVVTANVEYWANAGWTWGSLTGGVRGSETDGAVLKQNRAHHGLKEKHARYANTCDFCARLANLTFYSFSKHRSR